MSGLLALTLTRSGSGTGLDQSIVPLVRWPVVSNDQQQMPREAWTRGNRAARLSQNIYLQQFVDQ